MPLFWEELHTTKQVGLLGQALSIWSVQGSRATGWRFSPSAPLLVLEMG